MVATRCFTFNHAPYIEDAMNGFAMQETSFPVITIIVDDASTDGEPEVIRKYLAEHFQSPYRVEETEYANIICAKHKTNANCDFVVFLLKYNHYSIKKPKLPYLSEWNDNAKYIALCEGDDYWISPEKLQEQVGFLEQHPDYSTVYTSFKSYDVKNQKWRPSDLRKTVSGNIYSDIMAWEVGIWTLTICFRAVNYKTLPQPNDKNVFTGDCFLFMHLSLCGKIYYLDEETAVYRYLPISASHLPSRKLASMFQMKVGKCHLYFLERHPLEDQKQQRKLKKKYNMRCLSYCFYYSDWEMLKSLHIPILPIGNCRDVFGYILHFLSQSKTFFKIISKIYVKLYGKQ